MKGHIDFKSLFHSLPDLYLVLDPDLKIVDASDAYLESTHIKREKVIGRYIFDVFPENSDENAATMQHLVASLETVKKTKKPNAMAVQQYNITKSEEGGVIEERYWSPVNCPILTPDNQLLYILHRAEDVTEFIRLQRSESEKQKITEDLRSKKLKIEREIYKRAQEIDKANRDLREMNEQLTKAEFSASKLAAIVEFSEDAIIGLALDGNIESWNKGAEHLYGYTAAEMERQPFKKLFPKSHIQEHDFIIQQIKNDISLNYVETERIHKDGRIIPVSVTISPLKDKAGNILGACSIARDITPWKKMEKLKNEFISIVSHELRTPLTSIQGSLSLLVGGAAGDLPPNAKKLLQIGKQNSERLIRLINDILDIEKIESGKMDFKLRPVNISQIIDEAVLANRAFGEKFSVMIKAQQHTDAMVNVDQDRIMQVLTNLISNAVKFSDKNQEVTVSSVEVEDKVIIKVSNTGPGIPLEFQKHVFEKFAQADSSSTRERTGSGLGLSISKQIVEAHQGKIGFTSKTGETIFFFELPIYRNTLEHKKTLIRKNNILLCESASNAMVSIKHILEKNGFNVFTAETGVEAKQLVLRLKIDAMLIDLLSADAGISLIKEIRSLPNMQEFPIILISVMADDSNKATLGTSLSVLDWIEKPISIDRLLKAINLIKSKITARIPQILHVEDDMDLLQIIATLLENQALVTGVTTIAQAKLEIAENGYDLIILDLMLPDGSGIELLPLISQKHVPVIVFSAYDLPKDYVRYVVKALMKSKASQDEILETIKSALLAKEQNTT